MVIKKARVRRYSTTGRKVVTPKIASSKKNLGAKRLATKKPAPKKRAFISFKYEERYLKNYLKGQLRNKRTKVSVSDWSLKEGTPDPKWKNKAREQIRRCDKVVVVLGQQTHKSAAVRQEVKMAREMGKPVCQIKPTSSRGSKPVPGAGRQYNWNQKNLNKIFGE